MSTDVNVSSKSFPKTAAMLPVVEVLEVELSVESGALNTRHMLLGDPLASLAVLAERDPGRVLALLQPA